MSRRTVRVRHLQRARDLACTAIGGAALAGGFLALCWAVGLASIP
jgi:hypothetical protein